MYPWQTSDHRECAHAWQPIDDFDAADWRCGVGDGVVVIVLSSPEPRGRAIPAVYAWSLVHASNDAERLSNVRFAAMASSKLLFWAPVSSLASSLSLLGGGPGAFGG